MTAMRTLINHGHFLCTLVVSEPGSGTGPYKSRPIVRRALVQMVPNGTIRVIRSSLIWSVDEIAHAINQLRR